MNRKVKVGDKIRLLANYANCKPGDMMTVEEVYGGGSGVRAYREGLSHLTFNFYCTDYEVLTETPYAETELERLVRVANEGFDADATIRTNADLFHKVDIEYKSKGHAANRYNYPVYRIKPKPAFEPFYVGPHDQPVPHNHPNGEPAWLVKLEGDTLHVGCQKFSAREVVCALKAFDAGSNADCSFRCHRHGVYAAPLPTNIISWADADRILAALEKAGV